MHERDRWTDRRTLHDGIGRACIASCGKNEINPELEVNKLFQIRYSKIIIIRFNTSSRQHKTLKRQKNASGQFLT